MYFYKVYGLVFKSNIQMPQLLEASSKNHADAEIIVGKVPEAVIEQARDSFGEDTGEAIWFHNSKGYFYATASEILVQPKENHTLDDIIPFIQGYCFALFFRMRGMQAVHCSALRSKDGAILIAGFSGCGKSTICDKLLQEGYQLMADDVAILQVEGEKIMVYPAFPLRKMCRDALTREDYDVNELEYIDEERDKFAIPYEGEFDENPAPLHSMIILKKHKTGDVVVKKETGGDMVTSFLESLFLVGTFSHLGLPPAQMQGIMELLSKMDSLYSVSRPIGQDTLAEVYSQVKALL